MSKPSKAGPKQSISRVFSALALWHLSALHSPLNVFAFKGIVLKDSSGGPGLTCQVLAIMAETGAISQQSLLGLPAELLLQVLTYLEPLDLANVAQTCRSLHAHGYDDQIWQPLVNRNLPDTIPEPTPMKTFRDLYIAHHPHWFLPQHRLWFSDSEPSGKLLAARYDPRRGCIEAYAVVAQKGHHTMKQWEKDRDVWIHSFNPTVSLALDPPVLKLDVDSPRTNHSRNNNPSDRHYAPPSQYSQEILMETFVDAGLYSSYMLCRTLPKAAIGEQTRVWPPLRLPADARVRNDSADGYISSGHRPTRLEEVSQHNFRLRKWVEYTGRRSSPSLLPFTSPNGLSAAMGMNGPYFAAALASSERGGMSIRMPEDITTYATLPEAAYMPTAKKPWQGIWCGDYSGHGCEFLVILQPDKKDERPLPEGMNWLRNWFHGARRESSSSTSSYASAQEEMGYLEAQYEHLREVGDEPTAAASDSVPRIVQQLIASEVLGGFTDTLAKEAQAAPETDYKDVPSGRIEAIKLTGDPNIPRGEYTFIAPDIGHGGFLRVADEEIFKGARVVRSAGHIAGRGFQDGTV